MTLIKAHIITTIYNTTYLNKSQSAKTIETLLEIIKSTLASGEDVMISKFGKFHVKNNNLKRGKTSQTANQLTPKEQRVVTFLCSPVLKGKIDGKRW